MLCCWCDEPATVYLLGDLAPGGVDTACTLHAKTWGQLYRRTVTIPSNTDADLRVIALPTQDSPHVDAGVTTAQAS